MSPDHVGCHAAGVVHGVHRKGGFGKGALWVALRLPEGHVLAHANQARITNFLPCDDENSCRMAPDVVRAHPNPNPNLE